MEELITYYNRPTSSIVQHPCVTPSSMRTKFCGFVALFSTSSSTTMMINRDDPYFYLMCARILLTTWGLLMISNLPNHTVLLLLIAISILICVINDKELKTFILCLWLSLFPRAMAIILELRLKYDLLTIGMIVWSLLSLQFIENSGQVDYHLLICSAFAGISLGWLIFFMQPKALNDYLTSLNITDSDGRLFTTFLTSTGLMYIFTSIYTTAYNWLEKTGVLSLLRDPTK